MSQIQQILSYVKNINETLNLWVANAKKAEELPVMEIMDPDGLLIVSELVGGVWVSKRLQVQKIIDGLSMADQDNKVREVLLGTITEDHDLDYLLDNNGITVAANEIIVLTVLTTIDAVLVQKQYLWKLGKGEYNPIGSDDISTKLIELQPRFLNEITAEELTSSPSAIVYDFGVITNPILDVLNTADPARDYTDDEKIYYIRATQDGVNLLYNFVGTNGVYGDGELQMTESDLVLVYSSANSDITDLLNNKLDKGSYTGDAGGLDNRLTVLENFNPPPTTAWTGLPVAIWSGVGLIYNYNLPKCYIEGVEYPAITGNITLTAADDDYPRYSAIIRDASGVNEVLGVAQENPPTPSLDPNTQLFVIYVLVNAGETTPANTSQNIIYNEGTETDIVVVGSNLQTNNTTDPLDGTYCLNVGYTTTAGVYYFEFTTAENKKIVEADGFKFFVKFLRNVTSGRGFRIQFYKNTTPVSDRIDFIRASASGSTFNSIYGITYNNLTNYQLIYIPYSDFDFSGPEFNKIRIEFTIGVEMKFDYLALVASGGAGNSPDKKGFSKISTNNGLASATTSEDILNFIGENGIETKASGKTVYVSGKNLDTLWHKFAWANAGDVSLSGTTATSSAGVFESDMVGAKITIGAYDFIISSYSSASSVEVVSNSYGTVTGPNGSWGVYNKAVEITSTGLNLYGTTSNVAATIYSEATMILPNLVTTIGSLIGILPDSIQMTSGVPLVWGSGDLATDFTRDVGIRRNAAGVLEIFDGITAGQYRDLVVRNVFGTTATDPAHYVPLAQMETLLDDKVDKIPGKGLSTEDYTTAEKTKVSYITITQAVNLDDIETRVNDLDAAVVLKGTWDQTTGVFPGSGVAQAGWSYLVTGATETTIDGVKFNNGDRIISVADNASTSTYASNWYLADYTDKVNTVAGRTGNVIITSSDLSDFNSAVNALIATAISGKQDTLVSGTNIKTINGVSVLGSGDMTVGSSETATSLGALIGGAGDATPNDSDYVATALTSGGILKKITWTNVKAFLKTYFDGFYLVPQITITTSVSITTATNDASGFGQKGRNVVIDNSTNAINITVDGGTGFAASYIKHGTGAITFVQGSGRTLTQVDGTAVLNGAVGSTATISSIGTKDYLRISNA